MTLPLSERDMVRLNNVHPDLKAVVFRAAQITKQPFMVIEGVRTREQCMVNYGKGRTASQLKAKGIPSEYAQPKLGKVTWLNNPFASKHCIQPDSRYGEAVDLGPVPLDWNNREAFCAISRAMQAAAYALRIQVDWGGDWLKSKDLPHYELIL